MNTDDSTAKRLKTEFLSKLLPDEFGKFSEKLGFCSGATDVFYLCSSVASLELFILLKLEVDKGGFKGNPEVHGSNRQEEVAGPADRTRIGDKGALH